MKARYMITKAYEAVRLLPFTARAIEMGWHHDQANSRAHRWFYLYRSDHPTVTLYYDSDSARHVYTVGRDTTNSAAHAIELLEQATGTGLVKSAEDSER